MVHLVKYYSCFSEHHLSLLTNVSLMKLFLPLASLTLKGQSLILLAYSAASLRPVNIGARQGLV